MSGGGTRSGRRSKGGASTSTPAGVTYKQFMAMGEQEKYDVMERIIDDDNIKVPDYLDNSVTSKVMFALGLNNKPEIISDAEFKRLKGTTIYRTVNGNPGKITSEEIINQIKTSDYTQLSGDHSSALGRALYFGNRYGKSTNYANPDTNDSMVMRAKFKPGAKIGTPLDVKNNNSKFNQFIQNKKLKNPGADQASLNAIVHGYDAVYDKGSGYFAVFNRGSLSVSSGNKRPYATINGKFTYWNTWDEALDA